MTPIDRRDFLTLASAVAATPELSSRGFADAWPSEKVIRAVVPFGPGSTIDIIGRVVLDPLSSAIGQTIVVENRGGAGGTIGSAMVAKADPDGYTLLINASAHTAAPAVYPNLNYDPSKDFAGVAVFGVVPNVLLVAPSKGIKNAAELVERAKAGGMTFASAGIGSATHWAAERFLLSAGVKATHVPFSSGPAALTEVMTGASIFVSSALHRPCRSLQTAACCRWRSARSSARLHCRTSRPPSSSASPIPSTRSGMGCSRRRKRRGRSSSACTPRSARR